MIKIRSYKNTEFEGISEWCKYFTSVSPLPNMLLENGTFVLEIENVSALCVTVLLTQSKDMAYIFNFIKNPLFDGVNLEEYGKVLWSHCFNWAKEQGYSQLICFSDNDKLTDKYQRFGMKKNLTGLTSFIVEI